MASSGEEGRVYLAKSSGELAKSKDPEVSEWGNPKG